MLSLFEFLIEAASDKSDQAGKLMDSRGTLVEHGFWNTAQAYSKKKKEEFAKAKRSGMSDEEAHNASHKKALEYITSQDHFDNLKKEVFTNADDKTKAKFKQHKIISKEDFDHSVEDAARGAAHYLNHIHEKVGPIDVTETHHLTGPKGEEKTAREIGYTNADVITPVLRKDMGYKKDKVALNLTNRDKLQGSSLKYSTTKSSDIKARTHGGAGFHQTLLNHAYAAYREAAMALGADHPKVQILEKRINGLSNARSKIMKGRESVGAGKWKEHPSIKRNMKDLNRIFNSYHGKDAPGAIEGSSPESFGVKSGLRKIQRAYESKSKLNGKLVTEKDYNSAADYLGRIEGIQKGSVTGSTYNNSAAKVFNSIYSLHDEGVLGVTRVMHRLHRELTGVQTRRRKFVTLKGKDSGGRQVVPNIRTELVHIGRTTRGEKPKVGIHSLTNRMEEMTRNPDKFRAEAAGTGTINFYQGNDHWGSSSQDRDNIAFKLAPKRRVPARFKTEIEKVEPTAPRPVKATKPGPAKVKPTQAPMIDSATIKEHMQRKAAEKLALTRAAIQSVAAKRKAGV